MLHGDVEGVLEESPTVRTFPLNSIEGPRESLAKAYLRVRISMSGSVAGFIVCLVMHVARATMRCAGARLLETLLGFRNQ